MKTSGDFNHVVILPKHKKQWKIDLWCQEQFGPRWSVVSNREGVWCCFWVGTRDPGCYKWLFRYEKDAMLFLLRWSTP